LPTKILLTAELVNATTPPLQGERWIADSKVTGFGLRTWKTKRGTGKAFAIRATNPRGKVFRKTFVPNPWDRTDLPLGFYVDQARRWGRDEIRRLNGRLTSHEVREIKQHNRSLRMLSLTLGDAADRVTADMKKRKRSEAYILSVQKLFALHIQEPLGAISLADVSPGAVAEILVDRRISSGNIRTLKAFIAQIFRWAARSHGLLVRKADELNEVFWRLWEERYDVKHPELRNFKREDLKRIFRKLESEKQFWQQALCIRLFLKFGAPLTRVMSAEWAQIVESTWYPYYPRSRVLWFEAREEIDQEAAAILTYLASRIRRDFGRSVYLFPSKHGRQVAHIRSIDTVWRNTLHDLGLRHYSLWEFAKSVRRPNNPSYLGFFIRYYGPMFREAEKADSKSRILLRRRRDRVDSSNYK
jgi:hypothetical protein